MRNYVVIAAIVWALSAIPSMAQDPATGAAVGAGAGAAAGGVVGGPAGAAVGAGVGAAAGAAEGARPRDRVVVEPAPRDHVIVEPGSGSSETTCVHSPGTTSCTEVRH
jgi:hypothetical protein